MSTLPSNDAVEDAKVLRAAQPAVLGGLLCACSAAVLIVLICLPIQQRWRVLAAYLLPLPSAAALVCLLLLFRAGTGKLSWPFFLIGAAYLLGGIAFDILATVVHTPDLSDECNPIARALLDSDQGLAVVYAYGAIMQALLAVAGCTLWGAFLRHRDTWLRTTWASDPRSFLQFLKAALGGARMSWRQFFLPLTLSEVKLFSFYHVFWLFVPLMLGGTVERWYLGCSWFRLLPDVDHYWVLAGGLLLGLVAFLVWLAALYSGRKRVHAAGA
jgi:hypothetical protein